MEATRAQIQATTAIHTAERTQASGASKERATIAARPSRVRVERLILHGLDNRAGQLRLVDEPALLSEQAREFFALHVEAAAARADWRARFREPECEVAQHCHGLLSGSEEFVAASRALARRLYQTMRPQTIAPGDFVVLTYTHGDDPTRRIALLKLDPDQRLARTFSTVAGRRRVSISAAENLLPDTSRLQKCALLRLDATADPFDVVLLDTQAGPRAEGIATFFYDGFLTVRLAPSPRRLTRDFLRCTDAWLGQCRDELTPAQITTFYAARRAMLCEEMLDLPAFAAFALPHDRTLQVALVTHARDALQTHLEALPDQREGYTVDRTTASSVVNRVTLELDGGARLTVPAERFAELVRVDPRRTAENKYRIVIESLTLREVSDR
ncbi:MAG TPA: nucleoid-associated protein [Ktedonobacterales bacterium]